MDKTLSLSAGAWNEISRHAEDEYPEECCGVIFSNGSSDRVQRLTNHQNQLHALDPQTYPRTAAIAYAMDPRELEAAIDEAQRNGAKLIAFYHSHPDADAYFSAEDKAFAIPFGEPTFPNTLQIVVSVYNRTVKVIRAFAWSEDRQDFIETPLDKI
jgi:adenylyltransferase/sulfurtransferase